MFLHRFYKNLHFQKVTYIRYSTALIIGINGINLFARYIKDRAVSYLQEKLYLILLLTKKQLLNIFTSEIAFLGVFLAKYPRQ